MVTTVLTQGGCDGEASPAEPELASLVEELSRLRRELETLNQAVESNRLIGTAVGLVMARHQVSRAAAFAALTAQSQHANVKLALIAEQLVTQAESMVV